MVYIEEKVVEKGREGEGIGGRVEEGWREGGREGGRTRGIERRRGKERGKEGRRNPLLFFSSLQTGHLGQ